MNITDVNNMVKAHKRRKRVGRGAASGSGKTAGRGQKGAGSRAGYSMNTGFIGGQSPLRQRFRKRGFNNANFRTEYIPINLKWIEDNFESGATVDVAAIEGKGIKVGRKGLVKILGNGEVSKAINVNAHAFSAAAKDKIEKAGGKVEVIAEAAPEA